jgi:hypothetical protein
LLIEGFQDVMLLMWYISNIIDVKGVWIMSIKQMLEATFTVQEMVDLLRDHHVNISEQMIRRYLRQGKIQGVRSPNRKEGWKILGHEVFRYWDSLRYEGTIYEDGIDDATQIKRLFDEVERLEKLVSKLDAEKYELRVKLGLEDDMTF